MRCAILVALLTLSAVHAAAAHAAPPPAWARTRDVSACSAGLLAEAASRSSVVRSLLQKLEGTDVVVYVTDSMSGYQNESPSYLQFVGSAAGTRYVIVRLDRWRLNPRQLVAALGHELQHALEIAGAPDVWDQAGLVQLYRRIGWEWRPGRYETRAAQAVTALVNGELEQPTRRSRPAEPQ